MKRKLRFINTTDGEGGDVLSAIHSVAYGPALEGSIVKQRTKFYIEARNSSEAQLNSSKATSVEDWHVEIQRLNTFLSKDNVKVSDRGDGTFEVSYVPDIPGDYEIAVSYKGSPIRGSPFMARVYLDAASTYVVKCYLQIDDFKEEEAGDAEIKVSRQLYTKLVINDNDDLLSSIIIITQSINHSNPVVLTPLSSLFLQILVTSPDGVTQLANHNNLGGGQFAVSYTPKEIGDYVLDAYVNGKQAAGCPYVVSFQGDPNLKRLDPGRSIAYGPGLMDSYVGDQLYFLVEARNVYDQVMKDLKPGTVRCEVRFARDTGSSGGGGGGDDHQLPVATVSDNGDGTFSVDYVSGPVAGKYRLEVLLDGEHISSSPFRVKFKTDQPIAEEESEPPVTKQEPVSLEVTPPPLERKNIEYQALCRGLGLRGAVVDVETEFLVELYDQYANPAILSDLSLLKAKVTPKGAAEGEDEAQLTIEHAPEEAKKKGFAGSIVRVRYTPKRVGDTLVKLELQGSPVDSFPRTIEVLHNSTAYGPALEEPVKMGQTAVLIVETFGADGERAKRGGGKVEAIVTTVGEEKVVANVADNEDGTYLVQFSPKHKGSYDVQLSFNGRKVPGGPFTIEAIPPNYKVILEGTGLKSATVGKPASFTLDVRELGTDKKVALTSSRLRATLFQADNKSKRVDLDVRIRPDGTAELTYTPELEGDQTIEISLDGVPLEGTPFKVPVFVFCRRLIDEMTQLCLFVLSTGVCCSATDTKKEAERDCSLKVSRYWSRS